jgi:hypothetical protein
MVFFSCSNGGTRGKSIAGNKPDTIAGTRSAAGNKVSSRQTSTVNPGKDTVLRYKKEIRNNGPDQSRIDSIKDAKTKKKK